MTDFAFLNNYAPEKVTSNDFNVMKGIFKCIFNSARIEQYDGDKPELQGVEFFRYELEIAKGEANEGRRLWKSVNLSDEVKVKKLSNQLFTLGLEFKTPAELLACAEKLVEMTVDVRCWGWKPDNAEEKMQMHLIKGVSENKAEKSSEAVPF